MHKKLTGVSRSESHTTITHVYSAKPTIDHSSVKSVILLFCLAWTGMHLVGQPTVISVPFASSDPYIPHPAYNGHPVTFKAIARGGAGAGTVYYRWDFDGNGTWDRSLDSAPVLQAGNWYRSDRYSIEGRSYLPRVDPAISTRKAFLAKVEVSEQVNAQGVPTASRFASYPVLVFADIPAVSVLPNPVESTFPFSSRPLSPSGGDSIESVNIKAQVALDDALWFLHKRMLRTDENTATISGYCQDGAVSSPFLSSALFLNALARSGHLPAFPPGAYLHGVGADARPLPPQFVRSNDARYSVDPYAEDAARLLNYLAGDPSFLTWVADAGLEADDDGNPIPDTNNQSGIGRVDVMETGGVLSALAGCGLPDLCLQTGRWKGRSLRWFAQELVDGLSVCQWKDEPFNGEWPRVCAEVSASPEGPGTAYALLGLVDAEGRLGGVGVIINRELKYRVGDYLAHNQSQNGSGAWFTGLSGNGLDFTAVLLLAHSWLGTANLPDDNEQSFFPLSQSTNRQLRDGYHRVLEYLSENWNSSFPSEVGWLGCNWAYPDARFDGLAQGNTWTHFWVGMACQRMTVALPDIPGLVEWASDYGHYYINSQRVDGSYSQNWTAFPSFSNQATSTQQTAWAALTMQAALGLGDGLPPIANAGGPYSISTWIENGIRMGDNVQLDGSQSSNPDGSTGDHIIEFSWDINGDGLFGDLTSSVPTSTITWHQLCLILGLIPQPGMECQLALKVTDTTGLYSVANAILRIEDKVLNRPPVLTVIGDRVIQEGQALDITLGGSDPDGNSLFYSAGNLPGGANFDPTTGTFTWVPNYDQAGLYQNIIFTVTDDGTPFLQASETVTLTVNDVNRPPGMALIGNKTIRENELLQFTLEATDPDGDALTYSAANLPESATFDSATGTFSWTPNYRQAGNYADVRFTVADDGTPPMRTSELVTITVNDVNRPPVMAPIGDRTTSENELLKFTLSGTDPDGDALTYSAANLPEGATFDPMTGTFTWVPNHDQAGNFPGVEFAVTDSGTPIELATELITITVGNVNRAPVFDLLGTQQTLEGELLRFVVQAVDPDNDVICYSVGDLPAGAAFDPDTHRFAWSPSYNQAGNYTVTFLATDRGTPSLTGQLQVAVVVGNVQTPSEQSAQLVASVTGLKLAKSIENSYLANLKKVSGLVESGNVTPAVNQVRAFIKKVEVDLGAGSISQSVADDLIAKANSLIAVLQS